MLFERLRGHRTHLLENNLWVGKGRTRSQLHFDKENIVNCLFSGEKRWTLIDTRAHATDMTWVRGGNYNTTDDFLNAGTDWVAVDTESVDLYMFPGLGRAKFTVLTQKAGDCIFVPYSMLHAVEKLDDGLGLAVSYMWQPMEKYDEVACDEISASLSVIGKNPAALDATADKETAGIRPLETLGWLSLAAMDVLWYYSGDGVIPQGYLDPAEELLPELLTHRERLRRRAEQEDEERDESGDRSRERRSHHEAGADGFELMTLEVLRDWSQGSRIEETRLREIWGLIVDSAIEGSASVRKRCSGKPIDECGLTDDEVWWPGCGGRGSGGVVALSLWMEFAIEGDPEGMLNCDIGHRYSGRSAVEQKQMDDTVRGFSTLAATEAETVAEAPEGNSADRSRLAELWHDPSVVSPVDLGLLMRKDATTHSRVFEVDWDSNPSLRVLVRDGAYASRWVPTGGVAACDGWQEMSAAAGLETNSYSCHFDTEVAAQMLQDFLHSNLNSNLKAMQAAFGVTKCEHRDAATAGSTGGECTRVSLVVCHVLDSRFGRTGQGLARKAFTTLLSRELAADDLHADGCDTTLLPASAAYFTVLGYPHTKWAPESWGGHTEFCGKRCGDPEVGDVALGARTAAVLRVAPLPERTVVFEGSIMHRASWPEAAFEGEAVAGGGAGDRGSTVMQLVCWRDRSLMVGAEVKTEL